MQRRDFLLAASSLLAAGAAPALAARDGDAGLRGRLANRAIRFGAAIDVSDLKQPDMVALFKAHCRSLTPRNALKWMANEAVEGRPDYTGADRIVAFAKSFDCAIYGHTLIWYRAPAWVTTMTDRTQLRAAMRRRITQTIGHFGSAVYAWDVVNEPMEYGKAQWRDSVFQRLLGEDHIRECFELAHETDPNAQLVLNETHLEKQGVMYDERRALLLDLIERLRARNVPLHSVGLQAHFRPGLDRLDVKALGDFCATLKQMGVSVRITELDGSCRFIPRLGNVDSDSIYSDIFRDVVQVAATRGDLRGVTTWGLAEKYLPAERGAVAPCRARILPFGDDMQPRPAFRALSGALESLP